MEFYVGFYMNLYVINFLDRMTIFEWHMARSQGGHLGKLGNVGGLEHRGQLLPRRNWKMLENI